MSDFYHQMNLLRDRIAPLASQLGHPQARSLIVRRRYIPEGEQYPTSEFLEIKPFPIITTVSPSTISAFQGISDVQIEKDDFEVKGISHLYGEVAQLGRDGTGYSYFVDGVLNEGKTAIVSGIECDFVNISLSSTLTWDMVLRRRPDGR
jgi:hypothetical protein